MQVLFTVLSALVVLGAVDASCSDAQFINGRLHALCTDEVTGFDFEYVDFDGVFNQKTTDQTSQDAAVEAEEGLDEDVYAWYEDALNSTSRPSDIEERSAQLSNMWSRCKRGVSGACSNDHVIAWNGGLQAFIANVIAVVSEVNTGNREKKSPRSICHKYQQAASRFCVSWAAVCGVKHYLSSADACDCSHIHLRHFPPRGFADKPFSCSTKFNK